MKPVGFMVAMKPVSVKGMVPMVCMVSMYEKPSAPKVQVTKRSSFKKQAAQDAQLPSGEIFHTKKCGGILCGCSRECLVEGFLGGNFLVE